MYAQPRNVIAEGLVFNFTSGISNADNSVMGLLFFTYLNGLPDLLVTYPWQNVTTVVTVGGNLTDENAELETESVTTLQPQPLSPSVALQVGIQDGTPFTRSLWTFANIDMLAIVAWLSDGIAVMQSVMHLDHADVTINLCHIPEAVDTDVSLLTSSHAFNCNGATVTSTFQAPTADITCSDSHTFCQQLQQAQPQAEHIHGTIDGDSVNAAFTLHNDLQISTQVPVLRLQAGANITLGTSCVGGRGEWSLGSVSLSSSTHHATMCVQESSVHYTTLESRPGTLPTSLTVADLMSSFASFTSLLASSLPAASVSAIEGASVDRVRVRLDSGAVSSITAFIKLPHVTVADSGGADVNLTDVEVALNVTVNHAGSTSYVPDHVRISGGVDGIDASVQVSGVITQSDEVPLSVRLLAQVRQQLKHIHQPDTTSVRGSTDTTGARVAASGRHQCKLF